jgi:hypothetical protein
MSCTLFLSNEGVYKACFLAFTLQMHNTIIDGPYAAAPIALSLLAYKASIGLRYLISDIVEPKLRRS